MIAKTNKANSDNQQTIRSVNNPLYLQTKANRFPPANTGPAAELTRRQAAGTVRDHAPVPLPEGLQCPR